jgi:hypothetical protein
MGDAHFNDMHFNDDGILVINENVFEDEFDTEPQGPEEVVLPSGNTTVLEVPNLACLLGVGTSRSDDERYIIKELAKRAWRHPECVIEDVELDDYDLDYIYEWSVTNFYRRKEALTLAAICVKFHVLPSDYLHIHETCKLTFDASILSAYQDEEERQYNKESRKTSSGNFSEDD